MSKILVTGGSGFIGTNLVEELRLRGNEVLNLDRASPRNPLHQKYWVQLDILDEMALNKTIQGFEPEQVFHLAARTDLNGEGQDDYKANREGVGNLIKALGLIPPPRLTVFASSMLVCKMGYKPHGETDYCPTTAYGESKVYGESLVRSLAGSFRWVLVRPTSIWGPWFGPPYRDFFNMVQAGWYLHPKSRRILRSYGFVLNTVRTLAVLGETAGAGLAGSSVYLADAQPLELFEWATEIQQSLGAKPIREVPLVFLRAAALIGDTAKRIGWANPPLTSFRLNNLLTDMVHDISPIAQRFGPDPYTMQNGVRLTCDWIKSRGEG